MKTAIGPAVVRAPPRDDVMEVGMILELPAPSMQNAGKARQVGADEAFILGQAFEGLGGCLKQGLVGEPWM